MTKLVIRPAAEVDLSQLLEMVHSLAAHHEDQATLDLKLLRRDVLGPTPWLRVLVAAEGEKLLGYAALCPLAQLQFGRRGMDMQNLFVHAASRRQGVGRALIEACQVLAKAEGCAYLAVGTHPDNTAAQQVYLDAGFEQRPPPGPRFGMRL